MNKKFIISILLLLISVIIIIILSTILSKYRKDNQNLKHDNDIYIESLMTQRALYSEAIDALHEKERQADQAKDALDKAIKSNPDWSTTCLPYDFKQLCESYTKH